MSVSSPSVSKRSYEQTFDSRVHISPLAFRLHRSKSSATFFSHKEKVLLASLHVQKQKYGNDELVDQLKTLEDTTSLSTPEGESKAVIRHVTSWKDNNKEPSMYISLTLNILWVLWEWKRKASFLPEGLQDDDDFVIIILRSSELRGRAKLGVEMIKKEQSEDAYKFTKSADEVIVANSIRSPAILGAMSLSKLQKFMPSWCQKPLESVKTKMPASIFKSFLEELRGLKPPPGDFDSVRDSLSFALALLAPMLVQDEQQRAKVGSAVDSCDRLRDEGVDPIVDSTDHDTTLEHKTRVAEERRNLAGRKRGNRSPDAESLPVGAEGDSPTKGPPAKRRKVSEEGLRGPQGVAESADAERSCI